MMQNGLEVMSGVNMNSGTPVDLDEASDRKTNLIVNYLPQTMTQVSV